MTIQGCSPADMTGREFNGTKRSISIPKEASETLSFVPSAALVQRRAGGTPDTISGTSPIRLFDLREVFEVRTTAGRNGLGTYQLRLAIITSDTAIAHLLAVVFGEMAVELRKLPNDGAGDLGGFWISL
jgi:hypothetical protein